MTTLTNSADTVDLNSTIPGSLSGPDTIFAGDGNDTITTSRLGGSYIDGQGDADSLTALGPNDTLLGGNDDDYLRSKASPAYLNGNAGNDTVIADLTATLYGGKGDDYVQGNAAGNLENGNAGNDTVLGGANGNDSLYGGKGNDTIGFFIGSGVSNIPGFSTLSGGSGGNNGSNYLSGDEGDDFIVGINNKDTLLGGSGNDTLRGTGNNVYLDGGDGNDIVSIPLISFPNPFSTQPFFATSEKTTLLGGAGDDSIIGNIGPFAGGKNLLDGGDGNDTIVTYAAQDTVTGGAGNDFIRSATSDFLTSSGARTSFPGYAGRNILDGGDGNDTIIAAFSTDTMIGGAGDDSLSGIFSRASGGDGNDTIDAKSAGTSISGNVTLDGGAGNDSLVGNSSPNVTNIFIPGAGNDYIVYGSFNDRVISDGSGGNDTIDARFVSGSSTSPLNITAQSGNQFIFGNINSTNVIITGTGSDILVGGKQNDSLFAGDGNNLLFGDDGNDYLVGGAGNDSLIGGRGIDQMLGGAGSDSFYYFSSLEGADLGAGITAPDFIGDFNPAEDKLIIARSGFGIGNIDPVYLTTSDVTTTPVVGGVPVFILEHKNNVANLYYDPDGDVNSGNNTVQLIQFTNNPASVQNSIVYI